MTKPDNTEDLRDAYPISTFKGRTQDELVEFITAHADARINEVLDRLDRKKAYDPSGSSPVINPREIKAERLRLLLKEEV